MHKFLLAAAAIGGLTAVAAVTPAAATPAAVTHTPQSQLRATPVDYYWHRHPYHHRHWEHNHWRYYN